MQNTFRNLTAALLLAASPGLAAQTKDKRIPLVIPMDAAQQTQLPKAAPKVPWAGETLEYSVRWGLITVGHANLQTENIVMIDSTPAYHIVSTARSTPFVDTFFEVRDKNQSWINAVTLFSEGYSKLIREGSYYWDEWARFYPATKEFLGQKQDRQGNIELAVGKIPGPVQDMISALYYARTMPLETGKEITLDVNTTKNWPLAVVVHGRDTVKTPAGKFDCFIVEPKLREPGIFVQKGKSLKVWITADEARLPVMMKAEVFIGHVTAVLEKATRK